MINNQFPKSKMKLFIPKGNKYEFSRFGWGDMETEFSGYKKGYFNSANLLLKDTLESKNIAILDTIIYPILFLYRQYIELEIKWIIIRFHENPIGIRN